MNTNSLSISSALEGIKAKNVAVNRTTAGQSFVSVLNDLLKMKSLEATNPNGLKSSFGFGAKSISSYDSMFDSGFFGEDAVRIVDNRTDKYCSLCGSEIESDGSCPLCIVPTFIRGNTRAQNQAIENQHLQNHIQNQGVAQKSRTGVKSSKK